MAKIIWLASYPKSGNTWLRILLTNYLKNADVPCDINSLSGGPIASAREWFDEWSGIEASALDDELIERLRPDVYRCMAREEEETMYMKVHDAWKVTGSGEPLFPGDITAGVVYLIRNPLDMVASCANHFGVDIDEAARILCDTDFLGSSSVNKLHDQLTQKLGSWSGHLQSWLDDSGLPIFPIRYEDMQRDTEKSFGEVVRFCRIPYDQECLKKAVEFSAFGELQQQEKEKGFRERSKVAVDTFFRKGRVGAWRGELSAELVKRIIDAHGETMRRFGYLDDHYQPL